MCAASRTGPGTWGELVCRGTLRVVARGRHGGDVVAGSCGGVGSAVRLTRMMQGRHTWRALVVAVALTVGASNAAATHPDIEAARAQVAKARLVQALPLLDRAERSPELTDEDLLTIHWMRVVVHHGMGKVDKEQASMDAVLAMRPLYEPDPLATPPDLRAAFVERASAYQRSVGTSLSIKAVRGAHVWVEVVSRGAAPAHVVLFVRAPGTARYEKHEAPVVAGAADVVVSSVELWKAGKAAQKLEVVLEARRADGVAVARAGDAVAPLTQVLAAAQADGALKELAPAPPPAAEKPAEKSPAAPAENAAEKTVATAPAPPLPKTQEKPAEKAPEKAAEKPTAVEPPKTLVLVVPAPPVAAAVPAPPPSAPAAPLAAARPPSPPPSAAAAPPNTEAPANPLRPVLLAGGLGALGVGGVAVLASVVAGVVSGGLLGTAGWLFTQLTAKGADKDPNRPQMALAHQVTQYVGFPLLGLAALLLLTGVVAGGTAVGLLVAQVFV